MDKSKRNFPPIPTLTLFLCAAFLIVSCRISAGGNPATGNPAAGSPGGAAQVSVSDGVILLTPGAPLPTRDLNSMGITPVPAAPTSNPDATAVPGNSPTPEPTVDSSKLDLPDGLTIYPGATKVDTSGVKGANATNTLIFHTTDSIDQVITYYNQQLTQAGWKTLAGPANTPGPGGRQAWTWNNGPTSIISIVAAAGSQGGTDVTVVWMSL